MKRTQVLLILIALLTMQACTTPRSPVVQGISEFKVNRKNPERKMQMSMALEVYNPNKYKIKLKSHDLKIFLNGALVGETHGIDTQVMARNQSVPIRFALQTDLKKVLGGIAGLAGGLLGGKKGVDLRVTGQVRARARGIGKTLPIDFTKTINWSELGG